MARSSQPSTSAPRPHRAGSGPWIVFTLVLALLLIAVLAFVLVEANASNDQAHPALKLGLPSPPAFKMPSRPPILPH